MIDNIINVTSSSETYLIQEIQDERYEILFGDGIFGKKLEDGAVVTVHYTLLPDGEGRKWTITYLPFQGSFVDVCW